MSCIAGSSAPACRRSARRPPSAGLPAEATPMFSSTSCSSQLFGNSAATEISPSGRSARFAMSGKTCRIPSTSSEGRVDEEDSHPLGWCIAGATARGRRTRAPRPALRGERAERLRWLVLSRLWHRLVGSAIAGARASARAHRWRGSGVVSIYVGVAFSVAIVALGILRWDCNRCHPPCSR